MTFRGEKWRKARKQERLGWLVGMLFSGLLGMATISASFEPWWLFFSWLMFTVSGVVLIKCYTWEEIRQLLRKEERR